MQVKAVISWRRELSVSVYLASSMAGYQEGKDRGLEVSEELHFFPQLLSLIEEGLNSD